MNFINIINEILNLINLLIINKEFIYFIFFFILKNSFFLKLFLLHYSLIKKKTIIKIKIASNFYQKVYLILHLKFLIS